MPETTIETLPKGPFKVSGDFALKGTDGTQLADDKKTVFLCRCGASKNKPFCDGAHKGCDFDNEPAAA